ncbi:MAG: response regulator [Bacillota bacterium]
MEKLKVFIVDDSKFSTQIIKDSLDKEKFEIVGSALTEEEALAKAPELEPDLVTMDMTLKKSDGISCSRKLFAKIPDLNIIAISSMKDDEIIRQAKAEGIFDYLQKPIDKDELNEVLNELFHYEQILEELKGKYKSAFKESLETNIKRTLETGVDTVESSAAEREDKKLSGLSIIIGFIGKSKGRIILDTSKKTAKKITASFLGRESDDQSFIMDALSEFTNIIVGNAVSMLNKDISGLNLRLSPPTTFYGDDLKFSFPKSENTSFVIESEEDYIFMNVSLEGGKTNESRVH